MNGHTCPEATLFPYSLLDDIPGCCNFTKEKYPAVIESIGSKIILRPLSENDNNKGEYRLLLFKFIC